MFDIYNFNFDNMAREAVDTGTRELFGEVARMNSYVDETIFYVGIHDYAIHKVFMHWLISLKLILMMLLLQKIISAK